MAPRRRTSHPLGVAFVRTWLPLLLVIAAAIVLIVGPRGLAPGLLATAMFVIVADWIIRFAISSQTDRDREASARSRFARSGHWPEEANGDETDDPDDDAPSVHDAPHRTGRPEGDAPAHRPRSRRGPRRP
jgi:hypothetical protein